MARWMLGRLMVALLLVFAAAELATARQGPTPGPDRGPDEGLGPFERMVVRGATLIDGSGAPPRGPVDIFVEGNRIAGIRSSREQAPEADHVIEAQGMYVPLRKGLIAGGKATAARHPS